MPNLVKPRAGPLSAQRSPPKLQRRTSQSSDVSASLQKDTSPSEKSNVESSVRSPMLPEKKTPVPQVPQFSPLKKSVNKEQTVGVAALKNDDGLQKNVSSPLKERPTQERSCTQEEKLPVKPSPEKVKQTCSDRERILKARKLREMLKEELKKERMVRPLCWAVLVHEGQGMWFTLHLIAVVFSDDHQLLTASSLSYFITLYVFMLLISSNSTLFPNNTDLTRNCLSFYLIRPQVFLTWHLFYSQHSNFESVTVCNTAGKCAARNLDLGCLIFFQVDHCPSSVILNNF